MDAINFHQLKLSEGYNITKNSRGREECYLMVPPAMMWAYKLQVLRSS